MSGAVVPISAGTRGSRILEQWNAQRRAERAVAAQAGKFHRNFAGAAVSRLTASMASWSGSVNSDLDASLVILRARARALCANTELGRRFLSLVASNLVGADGPRLQVRALTDAGKLDTGINNAVEAHWAKWAKQADVTGRMCFAEMLEIVATSAARDGESLVRLVRNRALPYGLGLQLLEADRLDESINQVLRNGNVIRMGVELNAFGRPLAYHVRTSHPGENYVSVKPGVERVPAADILHPFVIERAEQTRGYTWMHSVLVRMDMLHGFEEAAVIAARVGASKMGVFKKSAEADPNAGLELATGRDESTGLPQMSAQPGEFIELPAGYELQSWDPDYPHQNFESFLKACIRGVAAGLNVAAHNLSGDMTDVNYSSARIAEMSERDYWRMRQRWLINAVVMPVYTEWLRTALANDALTFESGLTLPAAKIPAMYARLLDRSRFQPRTWAWVDPLKDVEAAKAQIGAGLSSRTQVAASQGREFEDIVDELKAEQDKLADVGVTLDNTPAPAAPPPPPPNEADQ